VQHFWDNVDKVIKLLNIPRNELAKAIGISEAHLSNLIRGKRSASTKLLELAADYLHFPVPELLDKDFFAALLRQKRGTVIEKHPPIIDFADDFHAGVMPQIGNAGFKSSSLLAGQSEPVVDPDIPSVADRQHDKQPKAPVASLEEEVHSIENPWIDAGQLKTEVQTILAADDLTLVDLTRAAQLDLVFMDKLFSGKIETCQFEIARKIARATGRAWKFAGNKVYFFKKAGQTNTEEINKDSLIFPFPTVKHVRELPLIPLEVGAGDPMPNRLQDPVSFTKAFPGIRAEVKYTLRVHGNSMQYAGIYDGDLLFVAPVDDKNNLKNGSLVIIADEFGDLLVKFFHKKESMAVLVSASRRNPPIIKSMEEITIYGKVLHSSHLRTFE